MMRTLVLAMLALLLAGPAFAQHSPETIDNYTSDITVHKNGTLTVEETIAINVAGIKIRHGIYRDFPTTYTDKFGRRVRVRFNITKVVLDGHPEPYSRQSLPNGIRVKIGSADRLVSVGHHVYTIDYTTDRQIGFFKDYDEIYWNVTGTGWIFPIAHAEATVHLPAAAQIKQYAAYTGRQGSHARNARAEELDSHTIRFVTTAALAGNEGLTVAVGFSKGVVAQPTEAQKAQSFLRDNAPILAAGLGLVVLLVYYFTAWWRFGRDPTLGTVIPLFGPPKGFSAAAVRYVRRMAYDRKGFAAALIAMAVKGYLKISEEDHEYTLTRTGKSPGEAGLSKGEAAIGAALFDSPTDAIVLRQSNHSAISDSISKLKRALHNEYESTYFVTNLGWFLGGIAILLAIGGGTALASDDPATVGVMFVGLAVWSAGTAFLVHRAGVAWHDFLRGPGSTIGNLFSAILMSLFALPFLGGLIFVLAQFADAISMPAAAALVIAGILAYLFYHLLKAPTQAGAKILAEIEGFRIFLDTAETDRLEKLNPPEVTPQLFERFLPFAIALDCENRWSKRFEAAAAAGAQDPTRARGHAYTPLWYSGSSFDRLGTAGFVSAIGASVAMAAAASATAPGSRSGSGGGGFSGGGGGGGGGGGW